MSLTKRKKRPLTRDTSSFRDDRLFIVACDDTYAPKQYFDFFKLSRVQVHIVPTQDCKSSAVHVLKRLLEFEHEEDDELWMLLDTDHCTQGNHFAGFISAISEAKQKDVGVALSKPCFEIWLLLHHVDKTAIVSLVNAEQTESALRVALGQYNKTKLKRQHYPFSSVCRACKSA